MIDKKILEMYRNPHKDYGVYVCDENGKMRESKDFMTIDEFNEKFAGKVFRERFGGKGYYLYYGILKAAYVPSREEDKIFGLDFCTNNPFENYHPMKILNWPLHWFYIEKLNNMEEVKDDYRN